MKKILLLVIALFAMVTTAMAQESPEVKVRATLYYPGGSVGSGTSSGKRINMSKVLNGEHRWVALPPRLRKELGLAFGDTIVVSGSPTPWVNGLWSVEDHMSNRLRYNIDFLVHRSKAREFRNGSVTIRKKRDDERLAVVGGESLDSVTDSSIVEDAPETASVNSSKQTCDNTPMLKNKAVEGASQIQQNDGDTNSENPAEPTRRQTPIKATGLSGMQDEE